MASLVDGTGIRKVVEDKQAFAKYVDEKFQALDKNHTGALSAQELQPMVVSIGGALGLPPKGSSPDSDHIYDEVLGEFLHGGKKDVTKEEFASVLRDILLGVADGLQRDPISVSTLNGVQLEEYAHSANFEVDAVGIFSQLDRNNRGKLKASFIKQSLTKLPVEQGMPPAADPQVMNSIVEPALQTVGLDVKKELKQVEFVDLYRKAVLAIAAVIKQRPITVAHSEKIYDGESISKFLVNRDALDEAIDQAWISMPKEKNGGVVPKDYLRVGLDVLAPFAGLPPLGAVEEMDHVIDEAFKLVDADEGGFADKEECKKCMLEILGSIMLQLQGKPISVSSSSLAKDEPGSLLSI